MTAQQFRERVVELVKDQPVKIWLTHAAGHRLDFLWSVGLPRLSEPETLARQGRYYLVGQAVPAPLKPVLLELFEEFCRCEEAQQMESAVRPLRFIQAR